MKEIEEKIATMYFESTIRMMIHWNTPSLGFKTQSTKITEHIRYEIDFWGQKKNAGRIGEKKRD